MERRKKGEKHLSSIKFLPRLERQPFDPEAQLERLCLGLRERLGQKEDDDEEDDDNYGVWLTAR